MTYEEGGIKLLNRKSSFGTAAYHVLFPITVSTSLLSPSPPANLQVRAENIPCLVGFPLQVFSSPNASFSSASPSLTRGIKMRKLRGHVRMK